MNFWLMMYKGKVYWELLEIYFASPQEKIGEENSLVLIFSLSLCLKEGHDVWSCSSHLVTIRHKPTDMNDGTETKRAGILGV